MMLPDAERKFYFDCLRQLTPDMRALFEAHFTELVRAHREPGEGDVDRAIRAAFCASGWVPPSGEEAHAAPRWQQSSKLRQQAAIK
jgi:hypothetical protein